MAKIYDGSTYLQHHLSANDYYCEHETVTGHWQGRAAERLGLHGEIHANDQAFERLRENRDPTDGGKLTPRDGENRVRFFDFQCSAQKSVSVMAVTLGDERLIAAHDSAAAIAFAELEKFAATQANTALQRSNRTTGNLAAAVFRHTASRALDPQIHTHHVVANATWDEASHSWRALTEYEIVRAIRYAGKVYQNELAKSCRRLGYQIETVRDERGTITGFEIAGVSKEIRARYSKRRAEVEQGIAAFKEQHGRSPTTAEIHAITVDSRNAKLAEVTTPAVIAAQRAQLSASEWKELSATKELALVRTAEVAEPTRERESLRTAVGHLFERRSVLPGHEILAEALNQNLGHLDLSRLHTQAVRGGLVTLDNKPWLHGSHATQRGLKLERWVVKFIDDTNGHHAQLGWTDPEAIKSLSVEQRRAVEQILGSHSQVVCLRGAAGVGKTTTLRAIYESLIKSGQHVHLCAPTTSAADTLHHDDMTQAITVAAFLANDALREHLRGSVFIVDEAGLASNQQGVELLQLAERYQARVLFLGDSRQHTSVEAGDFLRILETHAALHRVKLTDIRRQTVAKYREAVQHMAAGSARSGLERLDELGWVHESHAEYLSAAVGDYLRLSSAGARVDSVLAVTPTWEENDAFTGMLRAELKTRGVLQAGETVTTHVPLPWTKAQLACAANYTPGLVVTFDRAGAGFKRGEFARITRVDTEQVWATGPAGERPLPLGRPIFSVAKERPLEVCAGDKLLVQANARSAKLINGQTLSVSSVTNGIIETIEGRQIDTRKFRQFTHGFAVTSHRSQSKTCDHVVVAAARLDAKSAYVACSRGRFSCTLHTPDKAALLDRLPEGKRDAVLDFSKAHTLPTVDDHASILSRLDPAGSLKAVSLAQTRVALADPWWRGLVRHLAEWSQSALPRHWVDRAANINAPDQSRP